MMNTRSGNKKLMWFVALVAVLVFGHRYYVYLQGRDPALPVPVALERSQFDPSQNVAVESESAPELPSGVNTEFRDLPEIQLGWMQRAKAVMDNNLPEGVTAAEVQAVFFHRGFKGRAVTCGKVRLFREEGLVEPFQRFVFPGVQTIHYENEIPNFDIYWNKVCVETSDAYLPVRLKSAQ